MIIIKQIRYDIILTFLCVIICFVRAEIEDEPFFDRALRHRDACVMPRWTGVCRGAVLRYYFDAYINECRKFYYGGCKGNLNNFRTFEECERVCIEKNPCANTTLDAASPGCRYDRSLDERGCPKNVNMCDVNKGSCPRSSERTKRGSCIRECKSSDMECPSHKKCCKIGCNRLCLSPIFRI